MKFKRLLENTNNSNLYLYHATSISNLDSILKNGLLIHPPKHNWSDMYLEGIIYLAFSANVAEDYFYASDKTDDDIALLKIKESDLDTKYIYYDWNNRCEYTEDINSIEYRHDIPANKLIVVNNVKNEPEQDIYDFEDTVLFDIITRVFDEEVETNKEIQGD